MQPRSEWVAEFFDLCGFLDTGDNVPALRVLFYGGPDVAWCFSDAWRPEDVRFILESAVKHSKIPEKISWAKAGLFYMENEKRYPDPTAVLANKKLKKVFVEIHHELEAKWRKSTR